MSATNRGAERKKNDFYETPETVTRDFLFKHFEGDYHTILEPCCGSGKMIKVLRERYPDAHIAGVDIDFGNGVISGGADALSKVNFLDYSKDKFGDYDLIFTNPPYSIAKEIISHAMEQWSGATIVMLLRVGFLESKKRYPWWQDKLPTEFHILASRPSFTGGGNDSTAYAWFVWRPGVKSQKINVIWGIEE